jgi:hypothetical protein
MTTSYRSAHSTITASSGLLFARFSASTFGSRTEELPASPWPVFHLTAAPAL